MSSQEAGAIVPLGASSGPSAFEYAEELGSLVGGAIRCLEEFGERLMPFIRLFAAFNDAMVRASGKAPRVVEEAFAQRQPQPEPALLFPAVPRRDPVALLPEPPKRISSAAACKKYEVCSRTLQRRVRDGLFRDLRPPGSPMNSPLLLDEQEVASRYPLRD